MSLPNHLDAYEDCLDFFEQALADTIGLRIRFPTYGQAHHFTMRMHQARALQRALHKRIYPDDDPKHGRSEFDRVTVRTPREDDTQQWWVYIERNNSKVTAIEPLSTLMDQPDA